VPQRDHFAPQRCLEFLGFVGREGTAVAQRELLGNGTHAFQGALALHFRGMSREYGANQGVLEEFGDPFRRDAALSHQTEGMGERARARR